ncbi:MAG: secretin N-terminal domain-containing protein [Magnetococcales bacterium]|nr:secretin N-terminal domain-containing protein [Magnetococcales bacterium]
MIFRVIAPFGPVLGLLIGILVLGFGCVSKDMDTLNQETLNEVKEEITQFAEGPNPPNLADKILGEESEAPPIILASEYHPERLALRSTRLLSPTTVTTLPEPKLLTHPKPDKREETHLAPESELAKIVAAEPLIIPNDHPAAQKIPQESPATGTTEPKTNPADPKPRDLVMVGHPEPRFNIRVESAPTREFFAGLVKETPYNVLVHPGITGVISLDLKNVTVTEVIDVACHLYDFNCSKNEIGFQILPQEVQLRQFRLYYPNLYRHGTSTTQVSSGQKGNSTSTTSSDTGSTSSSTETGSGFDVKTDYKADFWAELTNTLCALLGLEAKDVSSDAKDRNLSCQTDFKNAIATPAATPLPIAQLTEALPGVEIPEPTSPMPPPPSPSVSKAISISPQTGVIMIRAYPSEIRQLKTLIDEMQANLLQQIVLEAKILEVTLSDHFQTGINWSFVSKLKSGKQVGAGQTGGGTAFGTPTLTNASDLLSVNQAAPTAQPTTSTTTPTTTNPTAQNTSVQPMDGAMVDIPYSSLGGVFAVGLALSDFSSFLELLKGQGIVSVLSSPRIATLNNQKAMIKVGVDDQFVTNIETKTDTNGFQETTVKFATYFSGVALDVLPQIVNGQRLILHIHPSVTETTDKRKVVRGDTYDLASNNMRESDSMVFSNSGEVIVIGGLMKTSKKKGHQSVPYLSDIPVVGEMFGHRLETEQKSELVILMRATITDSPDFWPGEIKASQNRMGSLGTGESPSTTVIN